MKGEKKTIRYIAREKKYAGRNVFNELLLTFWPKTTKADKM